MRYFERIKPDMEGIDEKKLKIALDKLAQPYYGAQALMLLRHGKVVAERYRAPYQEGAMHCLFSVSKSFTAIAVGFAKQEGLLTLDDLVYRYFPEYFKGEPCENMQKLRIRHLLMMVAGFDRAPDDFKRKYPGEVVNDFPYSYANLHFSDTIDWAKDFLHSYISEEPGNRFIYSSACTYMLSAIIQKITKLTLLDYLRPRLLEPLHIERVQWQVCSQNRNVGGWGMSLNNEDLAKFAQFMLQQGFWEGKQLLDKSYVEEMTQSHTHIANRSAKWEKAFGYQVWILGESGDYGGIGAFGQMYIVFPKLDAVFIMYGASRTYMKALDVIMGDLKAALEEPAAEERENKITSLNTNREMESMYLPEGISSWDMPRAQQYTGLRYVFGSNLFGITSVCFQFGTQDKLLLEIEGKQTELILGYNYWEYGETAVEENQYMDTHNQLIYRQVACASAWREQKYHVVLAFYETCYILEWECTFLPHGIKIKTKRNVGFVAEANSELIGIRI